MKLTPKEQDRLTIFTLAELARRRRARGIKINYPEAVALICDEVMEEARAGRSYDEVVAHGMQALSEEDVMEGWQSWQAESISSRSSMTVPNWSCYINPYKKW